MISAWTVLLIGIGTVFIGLVFIILLIVLLRVILTPKSKHVHQTVTHPIGTAHNSDELIAVITAAVALVMDTAVSNIRIASIQKAETPIWARAERMSRKSKGTLLR